MRFPPTLHMSIIALRSLIPRNQVIAEVVAMTCFVPSRDRHEVENTIREGVRALNSEVVVGLALLVIVLLISPIIILLVRMVTRTLQASTGMCHQDTAG